MKVEATQDGVAYVVDTYALTVKDAKGAGAKDHGKFLEAWKKSSDQWKRVADTYNSDMPLPQ